MEIPRTFSIRLSRAGAYLADLLEENGKPVLTALEFFRFVRRMYRESFGKKLYLRRDTPTLDDYNRLRRMLQRTNVIGPDRDYGRRGVIRVLAVSDLPAEDIVCLVDPTCYVSHLSAMQRWGLTDRRPDALMMTRPDRKTVAAQLQACMPDSLIEDEEKRFLRIIRHPSRVRGRTVHIHESKAAGTSLQSRGSDVRLSIIGRTFLDMLQEPGLCGGMAHVLDVWEEHAETYLDEIVAAVDTASSRLVKSRAGYILEERLSLQHPGIECWKALGQRGSSRKLDPAKPFAPTFSETWMISLNV